MGGNASRGPRWVSMPRSKRPALVVGIVLLVTFAPAAAGVFRAQRSASFEVATAAGPGRAAPGDVAPASQPTAVKAEQGNLPKSRVISKPTELRLKKAGSAVFDVRKLHGKVVKRERPEPGERHESEEPAAPAPDASAALPATVPPSSIAAANAPAPAPTKSFEGLDFANFGAGHPPDTNGDVGPNYYIETINTSVGIYNKSDGTRVAAFTFNSFMSQGSFGNLCDTNNFGDPVVLYDSFEDRWFISDFAFKLDGSNNVSPQTVFECFAVSKTGDPVAGGWNFYSILSPRGLADYPKFGVWTDGIYMSANMFGYGVGSAFIAPHVWAINKQQMYAGEPSVQVVNFPAPVDDFTVIPANGRLEAGTPPTGTPEYFVSTSEFLDALTVYKLHADWDRVSLSTFTGPELANNATSWPAASVGNAATPGNSLDTLGIRAMAQAQYSKVATSESLWVTHTVRRANTSGFAAPRWYQLNVTGGTVAANTLQGTTWDPDAANTFHRFIPALAVDRLGDMALGYSKSSSTTNPQIKYAGRLAADPVNTFGQTEQTLIDGTGTQTGNCGGATCIRWGDYSGMALDPDGCTFWITNMYYQANGLNHNTRIGSFQFPGCTTVGNGTLSGTVTNGASPISGATIQVGSRATTTNASGQYTLTLPAGTYPSVSASKAGFDPASVSSIAVPNAATATQNFTLNAAATSGCFSDATQSTFQRGTASRCDVTASPASVQLTDETPVDQNESIGNNGVGITTTTYRGQTFTPSVSGALTKVDVNLFCSGCTGTTPDLTLSIRATAGGLPTGADLVSGTITGFSFGGSDYYTAAFATPLNVTAGTMYAIVIRPTTNPSPGTYALTRSGTSTLGSDVYAGGSQLAGASSGTLWVTPTTGGVTSDTGFRVYVHSGFPSTGTYVSSLKDANPIAGRTAKWTTLSFASTEPAGTDVKLQVAASNTSFGATNFVGPDGTASTFFSTTGADLSQFNGFRYLRYKAFLTTTSTTATPTLSSVSICFVDVLPTAVSVAPATGTFGGTASLSATLTGGGSGIAGESIDFTLNGNAVGSATTNASGVATLSGVSLAGINAGSYPTAVGASFAGRADLAASGVSTGSLTVAKAAQSIAVTTHAPATAVYNTSFTVAATGGATGNAVTFSSAGACTNVGATFTMTSGTGTCSVRYDQAGNDNYEAAAQVVETVTAQKAAQTIAVTAHAPAQAVYNTSFTVAATGGATGNPVTFSDAGACTNVGATFTMTSGSGTCSVRYDQAGNDNYSDAAQVVETVTAQKASQTITVTTHAPASAVYGTSFGVQAIAPGGAVSFSSSGVCSNSGNTYTVTSGTGTCTVLYDQAGNDNYSVAAQVTETVTAQKANTTTSITSDSPDPSFVGQAVTIKYAVGVSVPGAGTATGNVTVSDGTNSCTGTVSAGQCSISFASSGSKSLTASYGGDANVNSSSSLPATAHGVYTADTVSVGTQPTGVAVAATRAYVANQGSNSVSVIDLTQNPPVVMATIPVGVQPDAAVFSADGTRVYAANFGSGTVSVIDTATNAVTKTVTVGSRPTGILEVGGLVYVANLSSSSMSVFDPSVAAPVATSFAVPPTGSSLSAPSGLAASANGQRLYVNDARNGKTFVFDLTQSPPVSTGSVVNGADTFPAYLSVSGTTGYSANPGTNSIRVLDLAALTATNVPVGSSPYGVVALPSLGEVFVTNSGSNTLTVIDTTAAPIVAFTIATGTIPDAIALSPDQQSVVVSNEGEGTVSIFHVNQPPASTVRGAQTASRDATASGHHGAVRIWTAGSEARSAPVKVRPGATHATPGLGAASAGLFTALDEVRAGCRLLPEICAPAPGLSPLQP
jgi:YVTN family beta-propeller protein